MVRAGALGDVLLLRPALDGLQRAGFDVTLLAPAGVARVLEQPGAVDVIDWESPAVSALFSEEGEGVSPFADRLAAMTSALAITDNPTLLAGLRARLAHVVALSPRPGPGVHAGQWIATGAALLGAAVGSAPPTLLAAPADRERAQALAVALKDGFVAVHPGSGAASKNWAPERFAQVVGGVASGEPVALVSGPADAAPAEALAAQLPRAVRFENLPLGVLGALLSRASLYLGNDSGVSHLAAAFGAPTLALFGPTDPAVWAPLGSCVVTLRAPGTDLQALDAPTVLDAAVRLRSEGRGRRAG